MDASRYRRFHVILGDSNMSESDHDRLDLIESAGEAPQLEIGNRLMPTGQSAAIKLTIGSSN